MALVLPTLVVIGALVLLSALFSMGEAAYLAVNKVRIRHLAQRGSPTAKVVQQLLSQLDKLIATFVVGDNLVDVGLATMTTVLFVNLFGMQHGPLAATLVTATMLLVFGDITPKIFGARHADRVALAFAWPVRWLMLLMRPLVWLFESTSQFLIRVLGDRRMPKSAIVTEEEIKVMIEMGREAGVVAEHELRMLHRIFEFNDTMVSDVMKVREEIVAVEITQSPEAALDAMIEGGHSRIPVYRGSLDRIEGILYAEDLLAVWRHGGLFVLADLIRPAYFVGDTKPVVELLHDFQRLKIQIAVVKNRQESVVGLVTLEDLFEEIVGEIQEEAPRRLRRTS